MPKEHDYVFLSALGRRLAERREELRLTQADVAQFALITPQQLSKYENGVSDPTLSTLLRICGALKLNTACTLVDLMLATEPPKGQT